jgi:hypothetical protein
MTAMALALKFGYPLVKGLQLVFQNIGFCSDSEIAERGSYQRMIAALKRRSVGFRALVAE